MGPCGGGLFRRAHHAPRLVFSGLGTRCAPNGAQRTAAVGPQQWLAKRACRSCTSSLVPTSLLLLRSESWQVGNFHCVRMPLSACVSPCCCAWGAYASHCVRRQWGGRHTSFFDLARGVGEQIPDAASLACRPMVFNSIDRFLGPFAPWLCASVTARPRIEVPPCLRLSLRARIGCLLRESMFDLARGRRDVQAGWTTSPQKESYASSAREEERLSCYGVGHPY